MRDMKHYKDFKFNRTLIYKYKITLDAVCKKSSPLYI